MSNEFISIIIPTYNRKDSLEQCINSIDNQNFSKQGFELIIVDDGSSEGICEFISNLLKKMPFKSSVISKKHFGPASARNAGVEKSAGTILAFTEDDVILDENWLTNGIRHFKENDISAVEGVTKYIGTEKPIRKYEKQYKLGFLPCNIMIRKTVFNDIGGYDNGFYDNKMNIYFREDIELGFRLLEKKYKAIIDEEMIVFHPQQYKTIRGVYGHAKRYFFDPLLCKKHSDLFYKMIEIKEIGFITIKRPLHYFSLISLFSFTFIFCLNKIFILMFLIMNLGFCYKYEIKNLFGFIEILPLPFYYLWYFLKGCFRFKSFRAII
ncbi:MAG: glycosyltransferase family 2 protein [Elusimicrobia bacterium]|nr:glycosyltransferase family 2 protein [Elusimicrobiota bacterium]